MSLIGHCEHCGHFCIYGAKKIINSIEIFTMLKLAFISLIEILLFKIPYSLISFLRKEQSKNEATF